MYLHGTFINQQGETIELHILTKADRSTTLEIGAKDSGLYFTDDPIEIQSSVNDTFDVLLPQTATIHLLTANYLPELFRSNCREAVVNIYRDGVCLFAGYIEPMAYSQDYNETLDALSLSCIDALSALQYSNYKEIGTASMPYATAKQSAAERTFAEMLKEILGGVTSNIDITGDSPATFFYDCSRAINSEADHAATIFDDLSISELRFMGDEEDDVWKQEDVLTEMLRYLNLHIKQQGTTFYIFAWETVKGGDTIEWTSLDGSATQTTEQQTIDITSKIAADCGTQISVGEVFNQLQLTCDTKAVDNVIESPLDDDLLERAFSSYQKYLTEYSRDGDTHNGYLDFKYWIKGGSERDVENGYICDWYIQVMRNTAWRFLTASGGNIYNTYCTTGNNQHSMLNYLKAGAGAAIIAWWGNSQGKEERYEDNTPVAKTSFTNYLVIPVSGNGDDTASGAWPTAKSTLERCPRAVYTGNVSGGVLSPSDTATTNYIVISGKMLLTPLWSQSEEYEFLHDTYTWPDNGYILAHNDDMPGRATGGLIKAYYKEDSRRYYTTQCFKAKTPTDTPEWDKSAGEGLMPPVSDARQLYEYRGIYEYTGGSLIKRDTLSKVGVLACMLRVGDKCVVETGTDGKPSDFTWQTYKTRSECATDAEYYAQCFYIGFNPAVGDKLIGTSFDIQNNISYEMGLDVEGMAIPIKKSDAVSGQVEFEILGPALPTYFEDYGGIAIEAFGAMAYGIKGFGESRALMSHVSNIYIDSFEMKIYSDNGLNSSMGDNDIIYLSDTDETFINKKDDITFKIHSALTTDERQALGVTDEACLSTPKDATTGVGALSIYDSTQGEQAKPEQLYVDAYYNEYHTPHVEMEQNLIERRTSISPFNLYRHPAIGKTFFVEGIDRNLKEGTAKLILKEI